MGNNEFNHDLEGKMKKTSWIFVIFALFVFIGCGSSNDDDESGYSGDSDNTDTNQEESGDDESDTDTTPEETDADSDTDTDTTPVEDDADSADDPDTDTGDTGTGDIEPGECPVITLGNMKFDGSADSYAYYSGSYQPGTGSATPDEINFEIYSQTSTEIYDLSEGYNASYSSCAQCIIVYEDIVYDNEGYFEGAGKYFFQQSGTMTVNSFSYDSGSLNVTLENVKLIQVIREYDSENDGFVAKPVENGGCLVIQNTTINI